MGPLTGVLLIVKSLLLAFICASILATSARAELNWLTDPKVAQAEAKQANKLVMLDFTGSDWCGWCIRLRKEVFSKPEFQEYANKNLVLVEIDFPKGKAQARELAQQNMQLASRYSVQGFPTLIVLDANGKKVGELGYVEGGPTAFIGELEKLRKG